METDRHVLITGGGHLAAQVKKLLRKRGFEVTHIFSDGSQFGSFDILKDAMVQAGIRTAQSVFVVDDHDHHNIQLALAAISLNESIPVIVSLFNERVGPHLSATHKNLYIRNPALTAAASFADALSAPLTHKLSYQPPKPPRPVPGKFEYLLPAFIGAFIALWLGASAFFRYTEHLSWLDSLYFVTITVFTVGYGDINLQKSVAEAKVFVIILMFAAQLLIVTIFGLFIDLLMRKRAELELGHKRYRLKDHVIVCGLGRVGYQIADELLKRGHRVLVIQSNSENPFIDTIRQKGAHVLVADATMPRVLSDAGVSNAAALMSVLNDDLKNIEIGLNARSLKADLRLVLRVFDRQVADELKKRLDIQLALSTSAIAAEEFVKLVPELDRPSSS